MFLRKRELISKKVIYTSNVCPPDGIMHSIMIRTSVIEEYWRTKWFWQDDYTYECIYEIVQNKDDFKRTYDLTITNKQSILRKYIDEEYLAKLAIINYKNKSLNNTLNNTNID